MFAITLNPGFVPILAGLLALAAPRYLRSPLMAGAALTALWLLLDHEFGAASAVAQMGLPVVLLNLDALNRIFGIALLIMLIVLSVYANARRSRYEDAAILVLAGGAVSALFVGDLVSFVAAAALAGFATAWVVFCSPVPGAGRAGVRLLVWQGVEGLLLLVGIAFHLSAGAEASVFSRLDATAVGGAFIFAGLLVRVGAPLAHVWLKDAISHASPTGAAALSIFPSMLGVYALARLFPAEPALVFIGCAMIVIGAVFANAEDDARAAGAYGLAANIGISVALIGLGSPLAMAAAEGHAFAAIFSFAALQMALGAILLRRGDVRLSQMTGLARAMPITCAMILGAGLAAAAAPGSALYASHAVALEASGQWEWRWVWLLSAALPGALLLALALRPALIVYRPARAPSRFDEAPFVTGLGAAIALFFCISIGLAPHWLYGLMPANLDFNPYALDRLAPHLSMMGAAGTVYVLMFALKLTPQERRLRLMDMDAFYRGPVAAAGRWIGVVLLRLHGAWQAAGARRAARLGDALAAWSRSCDRPYRQGMLAGVQFVVLAAALVLAAWGGLI